MNPVILGVLILIGLVAFVWSLNYRFQLIIAGRPEKRFDNWIVRFIEVIKFTLETFKIPAYQFIKFPRAIIFYAVFIILIRVFILWVRGFYYDFNLWFLGPRGQENILGKLFYINKDAIMILLLLTCLIVLFFRIFIKEKGTKFSFKDNIMWFIGIIFTISELCYDGFSMKNMSPLPWYNFSATFIASISGGLSDSGAVILADINYWLFIVTCLVFLNILPYHHFHMVTVVPNVFFRKLHPVGKLPTIQNIEEQLEKLGDGEFLGLGKLSNFTWKEYLDVMSCGEFGYCTDNCPANLTGKKLSPKELTIKLREHLYENAAKIVESKKKNKEGEKFVPPDIIPNIVEPEILWACTTCRACEEMCPGRIGYVDKIIGMRRAMVFDRGEVPSQLATALRGIETNGNPWNISKLDRAKWAEGLDIPLMSEKKEVEYLLWVGCSGSYDDRAQKITRATAMLLKNAGIDFAILGTEEQCTGDIARRAGDEFLYQNTAKENIEIFNKYKFKKIITICPHCYNTLAHEYPDLGGKYEVVTHVQFLLSLLKEKKLTIKDKGQDKITYHDSCYLGRYNNIYDEPRQLLKEIGYAIVEPKYYTKNHGMCCGAGGAQYFKEEEKGNQRINYKRIEQLLETNTKTIATACPFCMTMLTDGLKAKDKEDDIKQLDIAEILAQACGIEYKKTTPVTENK